MTLILRQGEATTAGNAGDLDALLQAIDEGATLPCVIWAGRCLSDAIPCHGALALRLVALGDLDRAPVTFQTSRDGVTFTDWRDADGEAFALDDAGIFPPDFSGPAFVRVRAGTAQRPTLSRLPRPFYAVLIFGRSADADRARATIAATPTH
jgi:hypothetical protein